MPIPHALSDLSVRCALASSVILFAGVMARGGTSPTLLLRSGDAAPADIGGTVAGISSPGVSVSRAVSIGISTGADDALLRRSPFGGAFETVLRSGTPLPGSEGEFLAFRFELLVSNEPILRTSDTFAPINARGDISLYAVVSNPDNFGNSVLGTYWAPREGDPQQVWRQLSPFPGIEGGPPTNGGMLPAMTDDGAYVGTVQVSNNFESPFPIRLDDEGLRLLTGGSVATVAYNRHGEGVVNDGIALLGMNSAGDLTPLVVAQGSVPGVPDARFRFNETSVAGDGSVAFLANIQGGDVPSGERRGVWSVRDGVLSELVRSGDEAAGTDAAFSLFRSVSAGSEDGVVFGARLRAISGDPLDDEVSEALYFTDGISAPTLLARAGSQAPGAAGGVFGRFPAEALAINARDQVAFLAVLADGVGGVEAGVNDTGLWAGRRDGIDLLVRTGDTVDVARQGESPDPRTVASIIFNPIQSLADNGRLGYTLEFNDGTFAAFETFIGTPPTACAGDFDRDGDVDLGDFADFSSRFGTHAGDGRYDPSIDFDFDGAIDLGDFGAFAAQFGRDDCGE